MGTTYCKMNYLLLSCGITCCLTIGILCHLLLCHNKQYYFILSCSSPAFLCYSSVLSHVIQRNCLISHVRPQRTKQNKKGPYGTILHDTGPYLTIWDHQGPYGTILAPIGQYGTLRDIQDHKGPQGAIQDHTGPYSIISLVPTYLKGKSSGD